MQATLAGEAQGGELIRASGLRDFWRLCKPNVMQLVIFTSAVAVYLAPGHVHPLLDLTALICIALGAAASAAINNSFDADIDVRMARTRLRPTASGRIEAAEALAVGVTLAIISIMLMGLALNWLAAALLALTIAFYVFVYTMWLKRRTPQNIVIGGAAGALPPIVGWAAVTGDVGCGAVALFAIIFFWTPPHFWALSLYRSGEYAAAGVPMLPVVAGPRETKRQMVLYTLMLWPATLAPFLLGMAGPLYGIVACVLSVLFTGTAIRVWREGEGAGEQRARHMFHFSLLYLFLIFAALLADRVAAGA